MNRESVFYEELTKRTQLEEYQTINCSSTKKNEDVIKCEDLWKRGLLMIVAKLNNQLKSMISNTTHQKSRKRGKNNRETIE